MGCRKNLDNYNKLMLHIPAGCQVVKGSKGLFSKKKSEKKRDKFGSNSLLSGQDSFGFIRLIGWALMESGYVEEENIPHTVDFYITRGANKTFAIDEFRVSCGIKRRKKIGGGVC